MGGERLSKPGIAQNSHSTSSSWSSSPSISHPFKGRSYETIHARAPGTAYARPYLYRAAHNFALRILDFEDEDEDDDEEESNCCT